jgi:hypothetical protein
VKQTVDQQSKWQVTEETSKIDDRKNVMVGLASNERVSGRFGPKENARLFFVCREGKTLAYIIFGGHFMSSLSGGGTVTYRVDKRPAKKRHMTESAFGRQQTSSPSSKNCLAGIHYILRLHPIQKAQCQQNLQLPI